MKKLKTSFPLGFKSTLVDSIRVSDLGLFSEKLGSGVLKSEGESHPLSIKVVENRDMPKDVVALCDSDGRVLIRCRIGDSEE